MSGETGDLGGFEIRFYEEAGQRMAEYVLCEGWCNTAYQSSVTADGDGFRFANDELLTGANGATETHRQSFRVVRTGARLILTGWYDGQTIWEDRRVILKPLRRQFGLDVAKGEE